jgi:hypothetical protein
MTSKSRLAVPAVLLAVLFTIPTFAQDHQSSKRRSVTPRTPGALFTAPVTGTITDAVTGAPIANVAVSGGRRSSQSDAQGKFEIKAAEGYGEIIFDADRSGYQIYRTKLSGAGPHVLNIQLQPTPTVTVKKTDNTTIQVDFENLKFGYAVPFSGYRASESESFCFGNGSTADVHKSQIRRIVGPGVSTASGCCTQRTAMKVTLEQKNGSTGDVWFVDSCETDYRQELIGTNHVTGVPFDIPFSDIAEIVFP